MKQLMITMMLAFAQSNKKTTYDATTSKKA